jgi:heat shock protein HslJ
MLPRLVLAILLTATATAGCGWLDAEDDEREGAAAAEQLLGRSFHSVSVAIDGEPVDALSESVKVEFEDRGDEHVVRFEANCNTFGGDFTISSERLVPNHEAASGNGVDGRQFAGSDAGCPDEQHEQDQWLNEFFAAGPTWQLADEGLLLLADQSEVRLEEE